MKRPPRLPARWLAASVVSAATGFAMAAAPAWPDVSEPTGRRAAQGRGDAALVIGIEDYTFSADIPGARRNAEDWRQWLNRDLGIENTKILLDQQATREEILAAAARMAGLVAPGGRLWLVYIGHGAPAQARDEGLLVGVDAQGTARSLEARGLMRSQLVDTLDAVLPTDAAAVVILDACFSGRSEAGDLAPGLAPLKPVAERLGSRHTLLTAAQADQYAGPLNDGSRPAFSYLLLGALRGWADADGDRRVTATEAVAYADRAMALTITGRDQHPLLDGPDAVLVQGVAEAGPDLAALSALVRTDPSGGPTARVEGAGSISPADIASLTEARRLREAAAAQESHLAAELERARSAAFAREAAPVLLRAKTDWDALLPLVSSGGSEARQAVLRFLEAYGAVVVTLDDEAGQHRLPVAIPEVDLATAALARLDKSEGRGSMGRSEGRAGYAMVKVPAGSYRFERAHAKVTRAGTLQYDDRSTIGEPFWIGETEVTAGLWQQVMGQLPTCSKAKETPQWAPDQPVSCVDLRGAVEFANALSEAEGLEPCYEIVGGLFGFYKSGAIEWPDRTNCTGYRLPTWEEWMAAATAGGTDLVMFGNDTDQLCGVANVGDRSARELLSKRDPPYACDDGFGGLAPVRGQRANAWGLYGMAGNVAEHVWVGADRDKIWFDLAGEAALTSAQSNALGLTWLRGTRWGSWTHALRVESKEADIGLRLARSD